jgi:hypothetical protein
MLGRPQSTLAMPDKSDTRCKAPVRLHAGTIRHPTGDMIAQAITAAVQRYGTQGSAQTEWRKNSGTIPISPLSGCADSGWPCGHRSGQVSPPLTASAPGAWKPISWRIQVLPSGSEKSTKLA